MQKLMRKLILLPLTSSLLTGLGAIYVSAGYTADYNAKTDSAKTAAASSTILSPASLENKLEIFYSYSQELAREDLAKKQGESLYQEAKKIFASKNFSDLLPVIDNLGRLCNILESQYEIKIIDREDEKNEISRLENKTESYYLIVEAQDLSGNIREMYIHDFQKGKTSYTSKWAEKVNADVWKKVRQEMKNEHQLKDSKIGEKRKGYMSHKITKLGFEEKQITEW